MPWYTLIHTWYQEDIQELKSFDLPWESPYFSLLTPEENWTKIHPCLDQVSKVIETDPGEETPSEHGIFLQLLTAPDLCQELSPTSPPMALNMICGLETAITAEG